MAEAGLAKIKTAKKTGLWDNDPRPRVSFEVPPEFVKALARNKKAKENFHKLAPSYRKYYIGWITVAKSRKQKSEE